MASCRAPCVGFCYSIAAGNDGVRELVIFLPRWRTIHTDQSPYVMVRYLRDAQRGLIARIVFADFNALEELGGPFIKFCTFQLLKLGNFIANMLF